MSRTRIFDLSRATPDFRQLVTLSAADFSVCWTVGLVVALATKPLFGPGSGVPLLVLAGVAVLCWALDVLVLAGLTGQSVGAMVAQTAEVSSSTGRPVGVRAMASAVVFGGAGARDPELGELRRLSLAANRSRPQVEPAED